MNREKLYDVCELKPEQKKAFNKLKRAYKECEKKGIFFVNIYSYLSAFDSELISGYGGDEIPPEGEYLVELNGFCPADGFNIASEWCDDDHILGLTEKGKEIYLSEE